MVKSPKYISINNYFINLIDNKPLLYSQTYSPKLKKRKTQKTYIKTNLASKFMV